MNTTDSWEIVKTSLPRCEKPMPPPGGRSRSLRRACAFVILVCLVGPLGCGRKEDEASSAKSAPIPAPSGILHLKRDEIARVGIEVHPVTRGEFRLYREFPATVQPNENELAEVTSLIRGRVVEVYVDFGQDVKKGELLALLHSTELGLAEASYLKATAKLHEAELAYKRARDLHQHRAVSLAEFQKREAEWRTARAEVREARNRLELLGVQEEEIRRLDREQTIRADVPLRAPFAGRVVMRNITRGEVVETTQKLFTIADLSEVWVIGNVPEKDVQFIRKDQSVEVVAAAYPHAVFAGTITYLGDVLDPATRTMRMRITVPNPDKLLKPEMFALVRVYAQPKSSVLTVPLAAVQSGSSGKIVFVQRDEEQFEVRPVKLGEESGDIVVVVDGLQEGERVVTKGAFLLKSEAEKFKIEPAR